MFDFIEIPSGYNFWTGWNDIDNEGYYVGGAFDIPAFWTNWGVSARGVPEPEGGRVENCAAVYYTDFLWHDYSCQHKHLPICYSSVVWDWKR